MASARSARRRPQGQRSRGPARARGPRWWVLAGGLGIAAAALYMLARGGGEPLGEIDPVSRARLESVLEGADPEGGG